MYSYPSSSGTIAGQRLIKLSALVMRHDSQSWANMSLSVLFFPQYCFRMRHSCNGCDVYPGPRSHKSLGWAILKPFSYERKVFLTYVKPMPSGAATCIA